MAEEKEIKPEVACPVDPAWLAGMLKVLPPDLQGKLKKFKVCIRE